MYVIYKLIDPRDKILFYVGYTKDQEKRFKQHVYETEKNQTPNWKRNMKLLELIKLGYSYNDISIVESVVETVDLARDEEIKVIKKYGRYDRNEGSLYNMTDGGDGTALPGKLNPMYGKISPFKNKKHTDESKKNQSENLKKYWSKLNADERTKRTQKSREAAMKARVGSKHTNETKQKISENNKGKKRSEQSKLERKRRMLESPTNIKTYKLISPSGEEFITNNGLAAFCREYDLSIQAFKDLLGRGLNTPKTNKSKLFGWEIYLLTNV